MMNRYEKGTLGKLVVQDWDVVTSWSDTPLLYILTRQQAAALVSLAETLNWMTRWKNAPDKDTIDAFTSETLFNLMNPITCEMLTACLQPLFDAQNDAIQQMLDERDYGSEYKPGQPLPSGITEGDLAAGTNPGCDRDITWAQSLAIVNYAVTLINDALELAESATNDVELFQLISSLPGINLLGADSVWGYIDLLLEGVNENFDAQVTETYIETLACEIFCSSVACTLTLNQIRDVLNTRLATHFVDFPTSFTTVADLLLYFVDQDIDDTIIADVLIYIVLEGGILANIFLGDVGTKPLEVVLKLAVDNASPDWEILCDCAGLCVETFNFANQPDALDIDIGTLDSFGFIESAVEPSAGTQYVQFNCVQNMPGDIRRIRLLFNDNLLKASQVIINGVLYVFNGVPQPYGGVWELNRAFDPPVPGNITFVQTRQDDENVEFILMGMEVIYEC